MARGGAPVTPREKRKLTLGLGFLAPNIFGFLAFTLIPMGFSLVMAFTDWDLQQHNMFKSDSVSFVGLENFIELFTEEFNRKKMPIKISGVRHASDPLNAVAKGLLVQASQEG